MDRQENSEEHDEAPTLSRGSWRPTSRSFVSDDDKSILGAIESVVAVICYWIIAWAFDTHTHLIVSVLVAPLLLMRSPGSIELGCRWFDLINEPPLTIRELGFAVVWRFGALRWQSWFAALSCTLLSRGWVGAGTHFQYGRPLWAVSPYCSSSCLALCGPCCFVSKSAWGRCLGASGPSWSVRRSSIRSLSLRPDLRSRLELQSL